MNSVMATWGLPVRALSLALQYRKTPPDTIFVVYGDERHQRKYWPPWLRAFIERSMGLAFPIAEMVVDDNKMGLVVATTLTTEELSANPQLALQVLTAVRERFEGTKAVALAGSFPSWVYRANPEFEWGDPFYHGRIGTRFGMHRASLQLADFYRKRLKKDTPNSELTLTVIGGAGLTGRGVVGDAIEHFGNVYALDPRYADPLEREKVTHPNIIPTDDPSCLEQSQLAMVFTSRGDQIANCVRHMHPGLVIGDDTHPDIGWRVREQILETGAYLYKTVLRLRDEGGEERFAFWRELDTFDRHSVPGCLCEVWVCLLSERGQAILESFEEFCSVALALGFDADLIDHTVPL